MILVAAVSVVFGCISALSNGDEIIVDSIVDEYPDDPYAVPLSLEFLKIGSAIWNACYACFLIALSVVWGVCAREDPVSVAGMPNSLAAAGIILVQAVVGIYRAVLLAMNNTEDEDVRDSIAYRAAPVIVHYGIMLTAFFGHNLIVSIFPKYEDDLYGSKHGSEGSFDEDVEAQGGMIGGLRKMRSGGCESEEYDESLSGDKMTRENSDVTGTSHGTEISSRAGYAKERAARSGARSDAAQEHDAEEEGVEVVGQSTSLSKREASQNEERRGFFSRMMGGFKKSEKHEAEEQPVKNVSAQANRSVDVDSECSEEDTDFGSQIVTKQIGKPVYEDASETTFGSLVVQKVVNKRAREARESQKARESRSASSNILTPAAQPELDDEMDSDQTSFGSLVLQKQQEPTEYDDGSETTFGSKVFQKVYSKKAVPSVADSLTENPGIEVVGHPTTMQALNGAVSSARATSPKASGDDLASNQTSFGSLVLQKVDEPIEYDDGSETTFGSRIVQKVYNKNARAKSNAPSPQFKAVPAKSIPQDLPPKAIPAKSILRKTPSKSVPQDPPSKAVPDKSIPQKPEHSDNGDDESETTFGSTVLNFQSNKKSAPASSADSVTTANPGIEVVGLADPEHPSQNILSRAARSFRGSRSRSGVSSHVQDDESNGTSFGSQIQQKVVKKPVNESGSETTFGSQVLQKASKKPSGADS
ncbi:MAG: hypothetical protein SGILL_007194, partial [Bacillariaceae sp.]